MAWDPDERRGRLLGEARLMLLFTPRAVPRRVATRSPYSRALLPHVDVVQVRVKDPDEDLGIRAATRRRRRATSDVARACELDASASSSWSAPRAWC